MRRRSVKSKAATDPTVDSQIVALQSSGANVLVSAVIPEFGAQAIRKWKPSFFSQPNSKFGGSGDAARGPPRKASALSVNPPMPPPTMPIRTRPAVIDK
jgi:branched-chain amino acid transport system substrate-binding protein